MALFRKVGAGIAGMDVVSLASKRKTERAGEEPHQAAAKRLGIDQDFCLPRSPGRQRRMSPVERDPSLITSPQRNRRRPPGPGASAVGRARRVRTALHANRFRTDSPQRPEVANSATDRAARERFVRLAPGAPDPRRRAKRPPAAAGRRPGTRAYRFADNTRDCRVPRDFPTSQAARHARSLGLSVAPAKPFRRPVLESSTAAVRPGAGRVAARDRPGPLRRSEFQTRPVAHRFAGGSGWPAWCAADFARPAAGRFPNPFPGSSIAPQAHRHGLRRRICTARSKVPLIET